MGGSRFVVRHVDVSIAAVDTIWRWRGWASHDDDDRLRDHRSLDVYTQRNDAAQRLVDFHEPLSAGLRSALDKVEWAVAEALAGAQSGWKPTLGALRAARRGNFRTMRPPKPVLDAASSRRPMQPVRLNRVLVDVTNVWEGATVRLSLQRRRVDLEVRSPGTFDVGDVPPSIQRALRYGGACTRTLAQERLSGAARIIAGRVPSYDLALDIERDLDQLYRPMIAAPDARFDRMHT